VEVLVRASEGDPTRLAALAADLAERQVDAIIAISPSAVRAAKSATAFIPIIADDLESDPVGSNLSPASRVLAAILPACFRISRISARNGSNC
jgi:ABC-type uncharacterized transport system substrate-binding protein